MRFGGISLGVVASFALLCATANAAPARQNSDDIVIAGAARAAAGSGNAAHPDSGRATAAPRRLSPLAGSDAVAWRNARSLRPVVWQKPTVIEVDLTQRMQANKKQPAGTD